MLNLIRKSLRGERGFTLIEMLVVIAIIALLLAVAAPKVINSLGKARDTKAKANIAVIQAALEQFKEEYGQYPVKLQQLKDKGFVKQNFDFKNGYGFYYFYAVGDTPGSTNKFRKYVLADPGKDPDTTWQADGDTTARPPEGVDPRLGAFFWGDTTTTALTQEIDYNHNGTIDTGETITVSDADAKRYDGTNRPTWANFEGAYATED